MLTGFFTNQEKLLGSERRGYPLYWLSRMIVSPQYSPPYNVEFINLLIDIAVWSFLTFVIFAIIYRKSLLK